MATSNLLTKIFGSRNDRLLKQYRKVAASINALEPALEKLSDDELRAKTQEFKGRLANGESLDKLLPEAFAVVREGSKRVTRACRPSARCATACGRSCARSSRAPATWSASARAWP